MKISFEKLKKKKTSANPQVQMEHDTNLEHLYEDDPQPEN